MKDAKLRRFFFHLCDESKTAAHAMELILEKHRINEDCLMLVATWLALPLIMLAFLIMVLAFAFRDTKNEN